MLARSSNLWVVWLTFALALPFSVAGAAYAEPVTVFALGDSLTAGYGLPDGEGLVPQLNNWLASQGAEVTVLSRSESKRADAEKLGAHAFLNTEDKAAMKAKRGYFDMVLNTIPVRHDVVPYLHLLRIDGVQVLVGLIGMMPELHTGVLLGRKVLTGSGIGGLAETQEMLDFCAEHNILPDIEVIAMQDIAAAYDRMEASDIKYRFVIDMESLRAA